MLVPISWLKNYVPVTDSPHDLAHKLTMAGIEIGEVQVIDGDWDREKVVVGHVVRVDFTRIDENDKRFSICN